MKVYKKKKRTCSVCNNPGYVFSRDYMCFWALDNIKRFEIETKTGRAAHLYALKGVVKEPVLTQALASENFSFSLSRIISAILWTSLCHDWAHSLPQSLRVQVSSLPEIQFPSALPSNNTTKLKLNLRGLAQKRTSSARAACSWLYNPRNRKFACDKSLLPWPRAEEVMGKSRLQKLKVILEKLIL